MSQLPKYNIDEFLFSRESLIACLNVAALSAPKVDKVVARHVRNQVEVLTKGDALAMDAALQTVLQYSGEKMTLPLIRLLASQLAGRHAELRIGPLTKFGVDIASEWVPVEVVTVRQAVWRQTQPGAELDLECLGGRPSGHVFPRKFPVSWLNYLAYRVGFTRRCQYPDDPRLFVGLRFWAHMMSAEKLEDLDFSDWAVDRQCSNHNKAIIKLRMRFELDSGVECPHSYEHDCVMCHQPQSQCIAAFHRSTPPNVAIAKP